jgi:hypothetical protein
VVADDGGSAVAEAVAADQRAAAVLLARSGAAVPDLRMCAMLDLVKGSGSMEVDPNNFEALDQYFQEEYELTPAVEDWLRRLGEWLAAPLRGDGGLQELVIGAAAAGRRAQRAEQAAAEAAARGEALRAEAAALEARVARARAEAAEAEAQLTGLRVEGAEAQQSLAAQLSGAAAPVEEHRMQQ